MAKTLHVKFQQGEIIVELEGTASAVHAELLALKTDGYGRLPEFFDSATPPPGSPPPGAPGPPPGPPPPSVPGPGPGPEPPPGITPPPEVPLVPIAAPARTLRFVVNALKVPQAQFQFGVDLDGDEFHRPDNLIGDVLRSAVQPFIDVQGAVDQGIAAFASPLLLRLDTEEADLLADQRVDVTFASGIVVDAAERIFTVDPSRPSGTLLCRRLSGRVESQAPLRGGAVLPLPVTLNLFGDAPVSLTLRAAQISFDLADDGSSLMAGQINGAISPSELSSSFLPGLAKGLTAKVAADPSSSESKTILAFFDKGGCINPDGTEAHEGDGVIDLCEVLTHSAISVVLTPDLQLFDSTGHYAPQPGGTKPDSLSVGLGFTAIAATF